MADFTLGVEEEYQLVGDAGELHSRARDVLRTDWTAEIAGEIQETQLEVGTRVCATAAEVDAEIRRLRIQVASAAAAEEMRIVAAGVHPFSRWEEQRQASAERYSRLFRRFGRVMRSEHIFGMHVHVAVPPGVDRARLLATVREYTPHLLALSASSPVFEGSDTGYVSYRSILARRLPFSGPPPALDSEAELNRLVRLLVETGATEDPWTLYWSVRPHPKYPTLEFRVPDVCPSIEDAVAIAALARALTAAACERRLPSLVTAAPVSAVDALVREHEWLAARYGLDAVLVDPGAGGVPLRDSVRALVQRVAPFAERLGDAAALARVEAITREGSSADRMRAVLPRCGGLPGLVEWLARESVLGTGMDRRAAQRETC